ncbi:MAG: HdeD family acid-resistance protein [Hyphomicrobiales bacterium]
MSEQVPEVIKEKSTYFIVSGIFFIIGGTLAILMPIASTLAVKLVIGSILIVMGLVGIAQSFGIKRWLGFFWNLAIGIIFLIAGFYLLSSPLRGVLTLTLLVALTFIAQGILEFFYGFQMRPAEGANWIIISGIISAVAGVLIFMGLPGTGAWVLGFLAGISLLSTGFSNIALGMAGRRAKRA